MKHITLVLSLTILLLLDSCQQKDAPIPRPNAIFDWVYGPAGMVSFINRSTNANTYNWVLGNGETASQKDPTVVYTRNGTYAVTLMAKGEGGESTQVQSVVVSNIPTTGRVLIWSTYLTAIDVSVGGIFRGTTAIYYPNSNNAPACGSNGNVTTMLPGGIYAMSAKSRDVIPRTWTGTITVENGKCATMCLLK